MKTFIMKRGDVVFEARFPSPRFEFLSPGHMEIHPNMLLHLGKYGLTLNDIRIGSGVPNLAEANAFYWLNPLNAVVGVWLNRLEVSFLDLNRITEEQIINVVGSSLEALKKSIPDISIATYTATLTLHGTFQEMSLSQFVAQYAKRAPEGLGPVLGSGIVYYLGPEAERQMASLVIDRSSVIADAALIRIIAAFDGAQLAMPGVTTVARETIFKILEAIDLEVNWGD